MSKPFQSWIVAGFLLAGVVAPIEADTITVFGSSNVVGVGASFTPADFGGIYGGTVPGASFGPFILNLGGAPFDPTLGTLNSVSSEIYLLNSSSVGVEFVTEFPPYYPPEIAEAAVVTSTSVTSPFMSFPSAVNLFAIHCREPCGLSYTEYSPAYFFDEPPPGALPGSMEISIEYSPLTVGVSSAFTELSSASISISAWANYSNTYDFTPASVVPIPAASLLFLSGTGVLGFIARKGGRRI